MIEAGADLKAVNGRGETATDIAWDRDNDEVLEVLRRHGAGESLRQRLVARDEATVGVTFGARYSSVQGPSGSIGLIVGGITDYDLPQAAGLLLQVEPGRGGVRLNAGYAAGFFEKGLLGIRVPLLAVAWSAKASVLRTWGDPMGLEPNQTFVGPEFDLTMYYVKLSVGYLWHVAGDGEKKNQFTWGVGVLF